jgi:hypothetical protein
MINASLLVYNKRTRESGPSIFRSHVPPIKTLVKDGTSIIVGEYDATSMKISILCRQSTDALSIRPMVGRLGSKRKIQTRAVRQDFVVSKSYTYVSHILGNTLNYQRAQPSQYNYIFIKCSPFERRRFEQCPQTYYETPIEAPV